MFAPARGEERGGGTLGVAGGGGERGCTGGGGVKRKKVSQQTSFVAVINTDNYPFPQNMFAKKEMIMM